MYHISDDDAVLWVDAMMMDGWVDGLVWREMEMHGDVITVCACEKQKKKKKESSVWLATGR